MINKVGVLNTAIASENTGDFIIMEAAQREVDRALINNQIIYFPTHEKLSRYGRGLQKLIDLNVACGTNLLHSHMGLIKQWRVGLLDALAMKPTVLLGVGWRSSEKRNTDFYTKWLLRRLLSGEYYHSVRDSYAYEKLTALGFTNVLNTGCPTTWELDEQHCEKIPQGKGDNAIVVLTDYSRNYELDRHLMEFVVQQYSKTYFWCQGTHDYEYLVDLGFQDRVELVPSSLAAYRNILADKNLSLDYVGTRLHGGIYALQHARRSIIIGVDHRANEMGKDLNLPVVSRYESAAAIEEKIASNFITSINLPAKEISQWRGQFS